MSLLSLITFPTKEKPKLYRDLHDAVPASDFPGYKAFLQEGGWERPQRGEEAREKAGLSCPEEGRSEVLIEMSLLDLAPNT